ncbi:MAG: ammonia-forming cytochrome c nitrite reductase subunit c552 [SAR324 cluster bacterium]|uniref:Ammonia-forming cytochrome c nitrite reductase subunit c552 n=1 Tax=SAR324 cluster bacterium TaxID=2024889 RepID=A0A7X9FRW3_9DELT|nr:ammonia-forming cytochrome c nitrite reductase subunit c552 [SAR324 cluster bacterium]
MQWDFISSGNSTGFHSHQEATRVLAQATDPARSGQFALQAALQSQGLAVKLSTGSGQITQKPTQILREDKKIGGSPPEKLVVLERELQSS